MKMSICTDAPGRVTGVCPDNLTGGTGWAWIETELTPDTNLTDERGIALYKIVDGAVSTRTTEEIDADVPPAVEPELTDLEKLKLRQTATENAVLFLMDIGGL